MASQGVVASSEPTSTDTPMRAPTTATTTRRRRWRASGITAPGTTLTAAAATALRFPPASSRTQAGIAYVTPRAADDQSKANQAMGEPAGGRMRARRPVGCRHDATRPSRRTPAQGVLLLGGQVGVDELGVRPGELLLDPVHDGVTGHEEEGGRAGFDLFPDGLDEVVVDPDVAERPGQRTHPRTDRRAQQGNEEQQAEEHAQNIPPSAPAPTRLFSCWVFGFRAPAGQLTMAASWTLMSSCFTRPSSLDCSRAAPSGVVNFHTVRVAMISSSRCHDSDAVRGRRRPARPDARSAPGVSHHLIEVTGGNGPPPGRRLPRRLPGLHGHHVAASAASVRRGARRRR